MSQEEEKRASTISLILSFLIPIVGVAYYFVHKKDVVNKKDYLYAALGGVIVGLILRFLQ